MYKIIYLWRNAQLKRIRKLLFLMRLTTGIILLTVFQLSAAITFGQKLTFNKSNTTIGELFKEIKSQTGYNVVWYEGRLNSHMPIDVNFYKTPLEKVLDDVLFGRSVTYEIIGKAIIIKIDNGGSLREKLAKYFTNIDVRGQVLDENDQPLGGAIVKIKGEDRSSSSRTRTDAKGEFLLKNVAEDAVLVISYLGYETQEVKVVKDLAPIKLVVSTGKLEEVEVVSTGYQDLPKERATGSFTFIDNKTLNRAVSPDLLSRLNGVTNGLLVDKTVGFNIRGRSTIFSNTQPLIVVDNFPFEGDISSINPNDVESVTLLKDAAAASIWGVRAGNGVLIITTKKGKLNQAPAVNLKLNLTIGGKTDLYYQPQLSSSEFIDVEKFLFEKGAYDGIIGTEYMTISPVVELLHQAKTIPSFATQANLKIDGMRNLDIRDQLNKYFFKNSLKQQYALDINGGGANQTYLFSAGYDKNSPSDVGLSDSRVTLKGNNTYSILKNKFLITTDITFSKSLRENTNKDSYTPTLPYDQIADKNGRPLATLQQLRATYTDTAGNGRLLDWKYRPLEELQNKYSTNKLSTTDYRMTVELLYKLIKELSFSINYLHYSSNTEGFASSSQQSYYTRNLINSVSQINSTTGQVTRPIPIGDIYEPFFLNKKTNYGRSQLNYDQTFDNKHTINAIVGYEISNDQQSLNSYKSYGYFPEIGENALVDVTSTFQYYYGYNSFRIGKTSNQGANTNRNISYYSNASYSYSGKYIISGSFRKDQSNIFGVKTNQKGIPLWSTGVAWNIYKEKFFELNWLSMLKLRTSFGYNGNVNQSLTAYLTAQPSGANIYAANYHTIINPPNDDLRWERVENINFGVDFSAKGNRLSGSLEYYIKNGIDLIGSSPIAPQTGVSVYTGNTADTHTKGIDIQINTININNKLKWYSTCILNFVKDKVKTYKVNPGNNGNTMYSTITPIAGYPIKAMFGYRWKGLDQNGTPQGELNGEVSKDYASIQNSSDYSQLDFFGSAVPTMFGGFINTFSYSGLELSFNLIYKLNYYFRRSSLNYYKLFGGNYLQPDYQNRWQKPGDELTTNTPAVEYPATGNRTDFYTFSSILVEKGDHIRIQDIRLAYSFSKFSLYGYAANLGIIWKKNKHQVDPEATYGYPAPKTIAFGIKADF